MIAGMAATRAFMLRLHGGAASSSCPLQLDIRVIEARSLATVARPVGGRHVTAFERRLRPPRPAVEEVLRKHLHRVGQPVGQSRVGQFRRKPHLIEAACGARLLGRDRRGYDGKRNANT